MEKLKLLAQLEYSFGKRVHLDTPMRIAVVTKTVEQLDQMDSSLGLMMHQMIQLATQTRIRDSYTSEELEYHNRTATRMFAREIYGEVLDDLFLILRHVHENHHDPELGQMVDALMTKLQP